MLNPEVATCDVGFDMVCRGDYVASAGIGGGDVLMGWVAGSGNVGYVLIMRLLTDIECHGNYLWLFKVTVSALTREDAQTCSAFV